jgi:hypothetical protein
MSSNALSDVITYLEHVAAEVRKIEEQGECVLADQGQASFQNCLRKKAELLNGLSESTSDLVSRLPEDQAEAVGRRMRRFSKIAGMALRLDSVFFMTALLYPEGHQPDEPNDLEVYIEELREQAQD